MLVPSIKTINILDLKGKFLVSYPHISDNRFYKTIIYVIKHDIEGAEGLVINKNSAYTFINLVSSINNLNIDKNTIPNEVKVAKILRGGPVNNDKIFILHSSDYSNSQTVSVSDNISYSKNIEIIESIIQSKGPSLLSIFIGNCLWQPNQLEEEIKSDTWLVYEGQEELLFTKDLDKLWQSVYELLGINNTNSSYFSAGEKILQ